MQVSRVVSAALLTIVLTSAPALAQQASPPAGPAETPPADFDGKQYVDSTGCVFVRAGVGTDVTWVPRLSSDRKQVCGLEPTMASGAAPEADAPRAVPTQPAEAEPAAPAPATIVTATSVKSASTRQTRTKQRKAVVPDTIKLVRVRGVDGKMTYCVRSSGAAKRYLLSDGRRITKCNNSAEKDAVAYLNGLGAPGLTVSAGAPSAAEIRRALKADAGAYRLVWSSGKLNSAGEAALAHGQVRPMAASAGARYVQVGAYANPANAERTATRLKAMNLPVAVVHEEKAGRGLRTVLAGPFDNSGSVSGALLLVRKNGYRDAFLRR